MTSQAAQSPASTTTTNTSTNPLAGTTTLADVTLTTTAQGSVTPDFIGFSYSKSVLSQNLFRSDNAPLIALFTKWGPGILRIGGNPVNQTTWSATGAGSISGVTAPADVDRLNDFLKATQWKVIYGLNGTTSSTALTAAEAKYVALKLGDSLENFEIGNEPDLYHENGLKPTTYTVTDYISDWETYAVAVRAAVSTAVLSGPATGFNTNGFTIPFVKARGSEIEQLTQHYYRANGKLATSTIDLLLTPDPTLPASLLSLTGTAKTYSIPKGFRMAETNSFYNGGAPGVSDGFGTALWMIQYCFTLAQNGVVGANFHGGGNTTGYTPIANGASGNVIGARAEYYGMLLFAMMGTGKVVQTQITGSTTTLYSYAITHADGTTAVALVNTSRTDSIGVTLHFAHTLSSAHTLLLTAPNLDVTTGFTFGGAAIQTDGSWTAATTPDLPLLSGNSAAELAIPSGSAVLILTE